MMIIRSSMYAQYMIHWLAARLVECAERINFARVEV